MIEKSNLFHCMFRIPKDMRPSQKLWYPAADVYDAPDGWIVKVELAGVSVNDVRLEIHDNVLHLTGTRRDHMCKQGFIHRQMEITYSRFEKTLKFPEKIEDFVVEHQYSDGLLYIYLRKKSA